MLLLSSAPRSEHDPDPCSDLEAPAAPNTAAAANIAMHPITGAFADPSHETACAAQLFRKAFPCHAFLMILSQALIGWTAFSAPPDMWPLDSMIVLFSTLGLIGRVLVHRMHDTVRGQRLRKRQQHALSNLSTATPRACPIWSRMAVQSVAAAHIGMRRSEPTSSTVIIWRLTG